MNRRDMIIAFVSCLATGSQARAAALGPLSVIPEASPVGTARLVVMMMPVLDVTLYGPQGHWRQDRPFALKLDYLRPLEGPGMARRAVSEMRALGTTDPQKLRAWQDQMTAIFPNVRKGDSMTAVKDASDATLFFAGNRQIGKIADRDFSLNFFAICLSPKTSQPELRKNLLGRA